MTHPNAFKNPEDEAAYLAAYDATLKLWPIPYDEVQVPSRYGTTHVVTSGPTDAPPLVLLHGFMNTLTFWLPNIEDLGQDFCIFAIDIMGHPSKSIPYEPIRDTASYLDWLTATLNGLNLEVVSLAGISFGGWMALSFAIDAPERVNKLVLLSPAASFQPLTRQFGLRAVLSGIIRTRWTMDSLMKWMGLEAKPGDVFAQSVLDLIWLGGKYFHMPPETRRVMPTVFTDEELRDVQVPVLLLIGEKEVICDANLALTRARRLIPNLEGKLVPQGKHAMSFNQHQIVDALVLEFLNSS